MRRYEPKRDMASQVDHGAPTTQTKVTSGLSLLSWFVLRVNKILHGSHNIGKTHARVASVFHGADENTWEPLRTNENVLQF